MDLSQGMPEMDDTLRRVLSLDTESLISEYDMAKRTYDAVLADTYAISVQAKWPEEQKKVAARIKTRLAGFLEPDTYRWLLRHRLGSILD